MPYPKYNIDFFAPADCELFDPDGTTSRGTAILGVPGSHRHVLKRAGATILTMELTHNSDNDEFPNLDIRYGP